MSFDDFPMLPSGVWVYIIYFPNEDNSVDSVLMCNPSRMKILHWLEGSVKWYGTGIFVYPYVSTSNSEVSGIFLYPLCMCLQEDPLSQFTK